MLIRLVLDLKKKQMRNKEYKKVLKHKVIDNKYNFTEDMNQFLKDNPDIKIIETISHRAYHVSIIYQVLIEVTD